MAEVCAANTGGSATLGFWALGYAFRFGADAGGLIGTSGFFVDTAGGDVAGLPVMAFWFFQLVFAGTAATIVSGAMAERAQFVSYLVYSFPNLPSSPQSPNNTSKQHFCSYRTACVADMLLEQ